MGRFRAACASLVLILLTLSPAWSQPAPVDSVKASPEHLLVPFGAYSEETGFQVGFLGLYFLQSSTSERHGSKLILSGVLTTRGQSTVVLGPSGSLDAGRLDLSAIFRYSDWPGHYWAGGNHPSDESLSYDMTSVGAEGNVLFSGAYLSDAVREFKGGISYTLESNRTTFDERDTTISLALLSGGRRLGIGPELQWDTRDHEGWPTRGNWVSVSTLFFNKAWGSDWEFRKSSMDLRHYHTLHRSLILALGGFWEQVSGTVPFDQLCAPDGSKHLRGLEKGRLRGNQQMVVQSELRFPITGKFFGTLFAEAGKVGIATSDLLDDSFHPAYGAGIRYQLHAERKLNFRMDAAWVDHQLGIAASFGEAI